MALTISGTSNGKLGNLSLSANTGDILDSANTSFFSADTWRITADFTITSAATDIDLTTNWERVDDNGAGYLGTGMTESSGVFTFPATGIWLINHGGGFYNNSGRIDWAAMMLRITTDNSDYTDNRTEMYCSTDAGDFESQTCSYIVDVTDTSLVKVKFEVRASDTSTILRGNSTETNTFAVFVRLGNT